MKHTVEITYQELVSIVANHYSFPSNELEVKIVTCTVAEGLWYPDDSGEWIEHDGSDEPPIDLLPHELVYWIVPKERTIRKLIANDCFRVDELNWDCVQAYRKV